MKTSKRAVKLIDDMGEIWVEGELSQTRITALIKAYKREGIFLTEKDN